jgi:signal transduction histidine kinase
MAAGLHVFVIRNAFLRLQEGRIWPKEVAGAGGVFCFTLPLKSAAL